MSGIVGSRLNNRGSGVVGSLGTDGQVFTSAGAGTSAVYETISAGMTVGDITGATALAAEPASTDEFVLSDAGTLKRMDFSHISNVPYVLVGGGTSQYPANSSQTLIAWSDDTIDIGGCFNDTDTEVTLNSLTAPAYSFVPNVAGIYNVTINIYWAGEGVDGEANKEIALQIFFNGAHYYQMDYTVEHGGAYDDESATSQLTVQYPFNGSGDYLQAYVYNSTGETPELNFGYSSMTIYKLIGTGTATRPDYG